MGAGWQGRGGKHLSPESPGGTATSSLAKSSLRMSIWEPLRGCDALPAGSCDQSCGPAQSWERFGAGRSQVDPRAGPVRGGER